MKSVVKGFTLIEAMITVAIVAIIASVAIPSYQDQLERGHLSECSAFAYSLSSSLEKYYAVNLTYPNSLSNTTSETGKCSASINAIGGTCVLNNADERCHGYTLSVVRVNSSGANLAAKCKTLTLSHRGEKGALDKNGDASDIDLCWR